jgi:Family of unknown function (DUF6502)
MSTLSTIILSTCLTLLSPLIRLMVKHGVTYTAFISALKKSFIEASIAELVANNKPTTDSAVSLLSGVHRRDVRNLTRFIETAPKPVRVPISVSAQLVAQWMSDPKFLDINEKPLRLPRSGQDISFDALASTISSDVRPRALLDDLIRLGVVAEIDDEVQLLAAGFAPRKGFAELSEQLQDNLYDHIAAACANLSDDKNFLEQSIFVDELSEQSVEQLHKTAAIAWRQAFKVVMRDAQIKFDFDQENTKRVKRKHRVRFGVYFYSSDKGKR